MMRVLLEIDPTSALSKLDALAAGGPTESVLDEVTAAVLNRIRTRFLAETDPDGNPWPPSHAAIRRRRRGGTGTLFDTGRLFRSIQAAATGPNERRIFTDVPYAAVHQFGLGHHIQRVFLGFSPGDIEMANRLTALRVKQWVDSK